MDSGALSSGAPRICRKNLIFQWSELKYETLGSPFCRLFYVFEISLEPKVAPPMGLDTH